MEENKFGDECASALEELRVEGRARKDPVLHFGDFTFEGVKNNFSGNLFLSEFLDSFDTLRDYRA